MPDAYNPWGAPVFPTAADNAMQPETFVPQGVQDWTRQAAPKDYNILSQIAGSLGKALMYPGQVAQSQVPVSTADMIAPAFNLASMLIGGGMPMAEKGALGMAGGKIGATASPEMLDAYKLGQKMRAAKQNWNASTSPTGSFDYDLAYGHIKGLSEAEADKAANLNPVLSGFHESGLQDLPMPTYTRGSRFGDAPKEGRSWNYRENQYEPGVSMARVDHPDFKDYEWADMGGNRQRNPVDYEGWLLPMKGTDDEPLMVGLRPRKSD